MNQPNLQIVSSNRNGDDFIKGQASRIKEIKRQIEALEKECKSLQGSVIKYMYGQSELRDSAGLLICRNTEVTRSSFNSSKFKADHPDVYELYESKTTYNRFTVCL